MNETLRRRMALAILTFAFPIAALADLSENTILPANTAINLDTGATASSGGDILWDGSTIAPQGKTKLRNMAKLGATNFAGLPQSYWVSVAPGGKSNPIAADLLVPADVIAVITNSGKTTKILITANSGGFIDSIHHLWSIRAGGHSSDHADSE